MAALEHFSVVSSTEQDTVVVTLTGELDPHTVGLFQAAIDDALDEGSALVLDLADLTFVDSSGIRVLIATHKALDARGQVLVLRNVGPPVQRVLEITGLTDVFQVEPIFPSS